MGTAPVGRSGHNRYSGGMIRGLAGMLSYEELSKGKNFQADVCVLNL